tara:strand:+ start:7077 stop:8612 length:1536 start_codon:yes stop_codon:yes gene_type:complete
MGNTTSTNKKSLEHIVNYLVANYITKEDFEEMKNLSNPEYCDDLVILTSKILNQYLNPKVIEYLAVKKGIDGENILKKDKVIGISKKKLEDINLDVPLKRQRMCIGLAKHYVQIAHIFGAISSTLNPEYKYKDTDGNVQFVPTTEKMEIPDDTDKEIVRNNLCNKRMKILLGNINLSEISELDRLTINPKFCDSNSNSSDNVKTLLEEPGIKELKQLYYDVYDLDTGKFNKMSSKMRENYNKDLNNLYKAFSDGGEIPKNSESGEPLIKSFSDIKLKDFYMSEGCKTGAYEIAVTGNPDFGLFESYAKNIKTMIADIKRSNDKLLTILDEIFVFNIEPSSNKKEVLINPELDDKLVNSLTNKTRETIIELYTSCEENFIKGLTIYEKIVKKQKLLTTKSQIENLKKVIDDKVDPVDDVEDVEESRKMSSDVPAPTAPAAPAALVAVPEPATPVDPALPEPVAPVDPALPAPAAAVDPALPAPLQERVSSQLANQLDRATDFFRDVTQGLTS